MSKIEWTDFTHNIVTGCTHKSPGCFNCYAETMTRRLKAMGQKKYSEGFGVVVTHPEELNRVPKRTGQKNKVFVCSMADLFHKDVPSKFIQQALDAYATHTDMIFQILTKRSERLNDFSYPDNVWLGVSVENQNYTFRIDHLRATDAKLKFISFEPLIGPVGKVDLSGIDWAIMGGESGPNARYLDTNWIDELMSQCKTYGTAIFVKQLGAHPVGLKLHNKKGADVSEWPKRFQVQEMPCK